MMSSVKRLTTADTIYQEILAKPADAVQSSGLKAAFGRLLGKRAQGKRTGSWIMWGGVGRGKTAGDGHVLPEPARRVSSVTVFAAGP